MSVQVLNLKTIEKLGNSILLIKKITYDKMDLERWENLLINAYSLNIKSWNLRYPSDIIDEADEIVFYAPDFSNKEKFNNECEVLKAMQCLLYNIEIDKPNNQEQLTINLLTDIINKLKDYIINSLQKNAYLWSETPETILVSNGIIGSHNELRLKRKENKLNPLKDTGIDIIQIENNNKISFVQCKNGYDKGLRIDDLAGFSLMSLHHYNNIVKY